MLPDEKKVRKCEGERDGGLRTEDKEFGRQQTLCPLPGGLPALTLSSFPAFQHLSFVL